MWDANQTDDQTVELKYTSADGEEGFPGTLQTTVTYHLTDDNEVVIMYQAVTDKPTVLNLTQPLLLQPVREPVTRQLQTIR